MKIGLSIISMRASEHAAAAALADALNYDSIWYGEHIVLPHNTDFPVKPQPYGPQELLDPLVLLAGLAAKTSRIRLATGILMLPLRPPIMAARQILAIDHVSNGRFDMAVGLGWLQDEYDAAGTDMRTRGARLDEQLDLIDRLFQPGDISFEGRYYRVAPTRFEPKPVQRPRPPFLVGGVSEAALKRAARWDGWYGVVHTVDDFLAHRDQIERFRGAIGRVGMPFEYVLVYHEGLPCAGAPSRAELEELAIAGVDRVVVTPWGYDYANALPRIAEYAGEIGLSS
ncbi:MAG: TIGR03619 family F420-dependent LLM class oxidoreductase [Sphingomonadaceae bacterium]|nr:TIGR03619 family F420-dependent LLM class oxidoreductase [Sphingomonadaceae bacterium]